MARRLFIWAAIGSLFLDQVTKILAYGLLPRHVPHQVLGQFLRLSVTSNERGLFGMNYGPKFIYFILPVIGMGLVLYFAFRTRDKWYSLAYGLVLGGAIGNLIDRVRVGSVIDFIDVGLKNWRWYTFNLADAFVIGGIILLLGRELFGRRKKLPDGEPEMTAGGLPRQAGKVTDEESLPG